MNNYRIRPEDLQAGDRIHFKLTGPGNGNAYIDVLAIHNKRISKWPWVKRTKLIHETICFVEPNGYPEKGTPYRYPYWDGMTDFEKDWYPLSYGVFSRLSKF